MREGYCVFGPCTAGLRRGPSLASVLLPNFNLPPSKVPGFLRSYGACATFLGVPPGYRTILYLGVSSTEAYASLDTHFVCSAISRRGRALARSDQHKTKTMAALPPLSSPSPGGRAAAGTRKRRTYALPPSHSLPLSPPFGPVLASPRAGMKATHMLPAAAFTLTLDLPLVLALTFALAFTVALCCHVDHAARTLAPSSVPSLPPSGVPSLAPALAPPVAAPAPSSTPKHLLRPSTPCARSVSRHSKLWPQLAKNEMHTSCR